VKNAAVAAALVFPDGILFFQNRYSAVRRGPEDLEGGSQADNAATYEQNVLCCGHDSIDPILDRDDEGEKGKVTPHGIAFHNDSSISTTLTGNIRGEPSSVAAAGVPALDGPLVRLPQRRIRSAHSLR
jgi:hypothetical protein